MSDETNDQDKDALARVVLKLAQLKEKHLPDHDGREQAATRLLEQFLEACRAAALPVTEDKGFYRVSLWHPPQIDVLVSTAGGDILIGKGNRQLTVTGLHYNPITKAFVGAETDGQNPLDVVTAQVAQALESKASDVAARNRPQDPEDDPDYQQALAASITSRRGF